MNMNFNGVFNNSNWLLKGDISGIQEFIFGVKSEGAAKTLKARSYYVFAMSIMAIDFIKEIVGHANVEVMYNGGGNFYLFCKSLTQEMIDKMRSEINIDLEKEDLHLAITAIEYDANESNFQQVWKKVNKESVSDKLRRFNQEISFFTVQEPKRDDTDNYKVFAENLTRDKSGFVVNAGEKTLDDDKVYSLFGRTFSLSNKNKLLENDIIAQIPRNAGLETVMTFEELAANAKIRTGTDKIGVLKLDVDFLGDTFNRTQNAETAASNSQKLFGFFSNETSKIWNSDSFNWVRKANDNPLWDNPLKKHRRLVTESARYCDNIYPVFAGGDDCMFVGAWDAIFEFALLLRKEFDNYVKTLDVDFQKLTFSAGIVVVGAKYPVIRFSAHANEALDKAKRSNPKKNRICIFDTVIRWDEFANCQEIAHHVRDLILGKNEPRSILERIARSAKGYGRLQERLERSKSLFTSQVWKLYYYIRNSPNREYIHENIVKCYEQMLLKDITKPEKAEFYTNPQQFPLAARWAELLTKEKSD